MNDLIGKTLILTLSSTAVFRLQSHASEVFFFFARDIKDFYQSSLGNEVDLTDMMNVPPNILAKN